MNNDGELSFSEYFVTEAGARIHEYQSMIANKQMTVEQAVDLLIDDALTASVVFNVIDGAMGGDGNGGLNAGELQRYYQNLDQYQGDGTKGEADGVITLKSLETYQHYIASDDVLSNISDETRENMRQVLTGLVTPRNTNGRHGKTGQIYT